MDVVRSYKYLGVVVSSDLSWSSHIQLVCMKAKKILGLIYRNFAKYTSKDAGALGKKSSSSLVFQYLYNIKVHLTIYLAHFT